MGDRAEKLRRATYADLEAVTPEKLAELIAGELYVFPRPSSPHARAASSLGGKLMDPFDHGQGGPGGWWILDEPELHFPDHAAPKAIHALVPDLAGWRRERMPELPEVAAFTLAPDWICEVLSPSTMAHDRAIKMPLYARNGVRWAWLVDPGERSLEVYLLGENGRFSDPRRYEGPAQIRAVPLDAVELDLGLLWVR